ncbi:hypothetical protein [Flavobacterium phycosphaerae]|uniref:hypothetical protein n=1 Tax=Flavobacterium phycosphaerae TaxID=2697515 RepID=UPI001389F7B3|nr:hypothetical protein [Flavobacterium phycosphaerae]
MKKILALLFLTLFAFGCESGSINNNNPNIPNYPINLQINLSLPEYSSLTFASGHYVSPFYGARGIVIFNTGSGFVAFDLACPNQTFDSCSSPMQVTGVEAKCVCDDKAYLLFTGQSAGQQYPMKQYNVQVSGNSLVVYN